MPSGSRRDNKCNATQSRARRGHQSSSSSERSFNAFCLESSIGDTGSPFQAGRDEPMSTSCWAVRSDVAVKDGQLLTKPPAAARTTSERRAGVTDLW